MRLTPGPMEWHPGKPPFGHKTAMLIFAALVLAELLAALLFAAMR